MRYHVVGLSHHTAEVELREALALGPERLERAYRTFPAEAEVMFLSTCNRVEAIYHGDLDAERVGRFLAELGGVGYELLAPALRHFAGPEAVRHVFRVAAGLDSMVLGEPQILGQWKQAFQTAIDHGRAGAYLYRLGQRTLQVAKRIRTESGVGRFVVSIASIAVELAEEIFDPLADKSVLVLGAGEMAQLATAHLRGKGVHRLRIANRTYERAREVAHEYGAEALPWSRWPEALAAADVVLVGAGAEGRLLTKAAVRAALRQAPRRPRLVIDLAVPRAVDPAVAELNDLFLYAIDDLERLSDVNRQRRAQEAAAAERLVAEAVERFATWYDEHLLSPLLAELNRRFEELRRREVARTLRRAHRLETEEALERATSAIVRRIVQAIAQTLKDAPDPHEARRALQYLLGVTPVPAADEAEERGSAPTEANDASADRLP